MLRSGRDILVHCRGGLEWAGTIGARLLIELDMEPATAIRQVRAVLREQLRRESKKIRFARRGSERWNGPWIGSKSSRDSRRPTTRRPVLGLRSLRGGYTPGSMVRAMRLA